MNPIFFSTPTEFREWLKQNFDQQKEVWVGFYKVKTGRATLTWSEAVDQALCFGWIDGIRKSIDEHSYTNRFTPRKPGSTWSNVNIQKVKELTKNKLMHPAGIAAFEKRTNDNSGIYSFEQKINELREDFLKTFKKEKSAYHFFLTQPPYYRKTAIHWVMQAKREETQLKRLQILIDSFCCTRSNSAAEKKALKPLITTPGNNHPIVNNYF